MRVFKATIPLTLLLAAVALNASPARAASSNNGESLYAQNCAMCHGNDGKGAVPGAPDFTKAGGVLAQSDDVLAKRILEGYSSPGAAMAMPPMQGQVNASQVQDILQYMHKAFGVPAGTKQGGK